MKTPKRKSVSRGIRIDENLFNRLQIAAEQGGFADTNAFIRAAIQRELAGRESGVDAAEERIAASLDRLSRELRAIKLAQQALFAFTDAMVKMLLTCVAEPPRDVYDQAVARAKLRYDRFVKSIGSGLAGDSKAALAALTEVDRD